MSETSIEPSQNPRKLVDHFFRREYAQLVASLTRKLGVRHWELVEDVVQSALQRALSSWSRQGVPDNASAWLFRVANNMALDRLRRDRRWHSLEDDDSGAAINTGVEPPEESQLIDDQLRMIFVCCDPCVPSESKIALALKTLCGFGNREIARALLTTEASIAKRITRAKQKLRAEEIDPKSLNDADFAVRLPDVQAVVYVLFNEGYSSTVPDRLIREDLCEEAVRLASVLAQHPLTEGPTSWALLALLIFHASRLEARLDDMGAMLLLRDQDRTKWDRDLIGVGFYWLRRSMECDAICRYHAEAWIAAEHCRAASVEETDWARVVGAYDLLCELAPSPVHALNRSIAIARRDGPQAGLAALAEIESAGLERDYYLWHAARAELNRLTGNLKVAQSALQTAFEQAPTQVERELICKKLDALAEVDTQGGDQ